MTETEQPTTPPSEPQPPAEATPPAAEAPASPAEPAPAETPPTAEAPAAPVEPAPVEATPPAAEAQAAPVEPAPAETPPAAEAQATAAEPAPVETPSAAEAPAAEAAPAAKPAAEKAASKAAPPAKPAPLPRSARVAPDGKWWRGTGRRKAAVARVRIRPGTGKFIVNKRPVAEFFHGERDRKDLETVLTKTRTTGTLDVFVTVRGGGFTGQSGAIVLGLARALNRYDDALEPILRDNNFLTRDPRRVERKKYGQPGARKRFQFSKR